MVSGTGRGALILRSIGKRIVPFDGIASNKSTLGPLSVWCHSDLHRVAQYNPFPLPPKNRPRRQHEANAGARPCRQRHEGPGKQPAKHRHRGTGPAKQQSNTNYVISCDDLWDWVRGEPSTSAVERRPWRSCRDEATLGFSQCWRGPADSRKTSFCGCFQRMVDFY